MGEYESELLPARKLPWLIDIFLYPVNMSGLVNFGIFWLTPLLLKIISIAIPMPFVYDLIGLVISVYLYYFIMECIRDSAQGAIRAPENIANMPDFNDALWQVFEITASIVIFWGPAGFYFMFMRRIDTIFWMLLAWGIFFFPIGLLSVAMFNSTSAFNPLVWFASIFSTFFQYCGLVLFFCVLSFLFFTALLFLARSLLFAFFFFNAVLIYLLMIAAHLLGRFYYLNSEKLNWEV